MVSVDARVQRSRHRTKPLDLAAAALVAQRPRTEVLAVVRQDSIAPFAQARARPCHHFATIEEAGAGSDPDLMSAGETFERNLFHRAVPQSARKAAIVNDAPIPDVDSVMLVENARADEMGSERRLLVGTKRPVAVVQPFVDGVKVNDIFGPPGHVKDRTRTRAQRGSHEGIELYEGVPGAKATQGALRSHLPGTRLQSPGHCRKIAARRCSESRDAEPHCHLDEVRQRSGVHLAHHPAAVRLHRDLADAQLATDLLVEAS